MSLMRIFLTSCFALMLAPQVCKSGALYEKYEGDELSVVIFCKAIVGYMSKKNEDGLLSSRERFNDDDKSLVDQAADTHLANQYAGARRTIEVQISKKGHEISDEAFAEVVAAWHDCVDHYRRLQQ